MVQNREAHIVTITTEKAPGAASVLAEAFMDYPVIRYFFEDQGNRYGQCVADLYHLSVNGVLAKSGQVLGVEIQGNLAAAACLKGPAVLPDTGEIQDEAGRFFNFIGPQAANRIRFYNEIQEQNLHLEPHYYLEDIGVLPVYRGMGLTRVLLQYIHQISAGDPLSTGVGLDTQVPVNVDIYLHFGYRVIAKTNLDGIPFWSMFRDDRN